MHTNRVRCPLTIVLAALLALTLAACGGGGATNGSGSDEAITIVATEYSFDPSDLELPAGTPVEIVLNNRGVIEHDWTIEELGIHIHANPLTTTSATVTIPAGTYVVYCLIPGHREVGMEGTVTAR